MRNASRREGQFIGTRAELERRSRRYKGTIYWKDNARPVGHVDEVMVDDAGTIYARSPESGRFALVVGQCLLSPVGG